MFLFLVVGCTVGETSTVLHCDLTVPVFDAAELAPGATARAVTRPMTESWDTTVGVGSVAATGVSVDRAECDACDTCREEQECNVCGTCTACADDCASCVESVSFVVPDLAPGTYGVVVTNLHAASVAVDLTVTSPDTGGTDTGDTGAGDSGDTGAADSGDTAEP